MPVFPQRKSIRLQGYDYSSSGWYYLTVCTQNRQELFGKIINRRMVLNDVGQMINQWWLKIIQRFKNVILDKYQIMPNHLHGIIVISSVGAGFMPARSMRGTITIRAATRAAPTLGDIIGAFKSLTTREYINGVRNKHWLPFDKRLWQRNYYEHIIKNENDLNKIRKYIQLNPMLWHRDRNNPARNI